MRMMKSMPFPFDETDSTVLRAVEMYEDFLTSNPNATPAQIYARFTSMDLARIVFYLYQNRGNKEEISGDYITDFELCETTNGAYSSSQNIAQNKLTEASTQQP